MLCAAALMLPGCGESTPPPPEPLSEEAMAAVIVEPGVPREPLARAIDAAFTDEGIGETRALIITHRGEIVAERYADGFDAETRFTGWSVSKTVTGVLIGMMEAEGRLALDQAAPIAHWQRTGDPRGEVTLRHLLQMRSGLRHEEKAEPVYTSGEVRMMFLDGREDIAAWAQAQPLEHEPGSHFQYSTPTSVILSDIGARMLAPDGSPQERQAAMAEFLQSRLAEPLGMASMVAEYDAAGTMAGGSHIWANARDWAKFGEFLRHDGQVNGISIIPESWIQFMRSSNPSAPDYGAHLWINRSSGTVREMLFPDQGPDSLFAAIGHLGQYILVSPQQQLTIVRFGRTDQEDRRALVGRLAAINGLYPAR